LICRAIRWNNGLVTAAPKVEPPPEVDRDADGWALLDGLRRRMDDQAGQARRTHDQVQQLAESIAALVSAQRRRTRWLNLNSFGAYVLFTVLTGAAAFALYTSRAGELVDQRDRATADGAALKVRADAAEARSAARDAADAKAAEAWELFARGDRKAALAKLAELGDAPVGTVARAALDAKAADAHAVSSGGAGDRGGGGGDRDAATRAAMAAFHAGRYADARGPLEAAVAAEPGTRAAASWRYALGVIAAKDGKLDVAVAQLDAAIAAGVGEDDAHYQLALVLDRKGDATRAKAEYDRFAQGHPQMQLAAFARQRSAALAHAAPAAAVVATPPKTATPISPAGSAQPPAAPSLPTTAPTTVEPPAAPPPASDAP
jgi:tetratricopeptide (TPR) repeat protein